LKEEIEMGIFLNVKLFEARIYTKRTVDVISK